ncbi:MULTISPECIES: hypothetical protein [unclassified Croceitalea]
MIDNQNLENICIVQQRRSCHEIPQLPLYMTENGMDYSREEK